MIYILYFFVYSFLGWLLEVAYAYKKNGKLVNRGFLSGPFVPIYGFSMTALHLLMFSFNDSYQGLAVTEVLLVFITVIVLSSLLELIGGALLFNIFEARWWDYSANRFNFRGYISLKFSLIWGVLGTLVFLGFHVHYLIPVLDALEGTWAVALTVVLLLLLLADTVTTVVDLFNFKAFVREVRERAARLQELAETREGQHDSRFQAFRSHVRIFLESLSGSERIQILKKRFDRLRRNADSLRGRAAEEFEGLHSTFTKLLGNRLSRVFPDVKIKTDVVEDEEADGNNEENRS